ncbi:MAG: DUF2093 domain-containing protein [Novosphingobium sp.]|nr:DUF2093 domain-containing protein [Novosphingobium sp.]
MLMSSNDAAAILLYEPNGFSVRKAGSHVICAVSSRQIPLEELRYWCVVRQEAYASPELATQRLLGQA